MSAKVTAVLPGDMEEYNLANTTPEEAQAEARANEDDLLTGLLAAANYKDDDDETVEIVIQNSLYTDPPYKSICYLYLNTDFTYIYEIGVSVFVFIRQNGKYVIEVIHIWNTRNEIIFLV